MIPIVLYSDLPANYAPNVLEVDVEKPRISNVPSLNILLMLVGSRGEHFVGDRGLSMKVSQRCMPLWWQATSSRTCESTLVIIM